MGPRIVPLAAVMPRMPHVDTFKPAGVCLPCGIGCHNDTLAACQVSFELRPDQRPLVGNARQPFLIPPAAHPERNAVHPFSQKRRHIVGEIERPFVELRHRRRQRRIIDSLTVHIQLVITEGVYVNARVCGLFSQFKGLPQPRGLRIPLRGVHADIGPLPIAGVQQAHAPRRSLAPRAFTAISVPDLHLPIAPLPGRQRLARVCDQHTLRGVNLPAVPEIALLSRQHLRRGRHQNPIRRLSRAALVRFDNPAQPGRFRVYPEGILQVFAAQPAHNYALLPLASPRRAYCPDNSQRYNHHAKSQHVSTSCVLRASPRSTLCPNK